jgi:hypothetical protein
MLEAELRISQALFSTTNLTPTAITNEWDDFTNATPIDDVEASVRRIHTATGVWPDSLIVTKTGFRDLRQCDQILDRISATGAGDKIKATDVTPAMLAAVFDLRQILVAAGDYNTADEGQSASLSPIWNPEYAMVAKLAESNSIEEPCLGRTFHWTADGSQQGGTVESYYSDPDRSDVTRVRHDVDEKILYLELADLLSNIYTA